MEPARQIEQGLEALSLPTDTSQVERSLKYLELIRRWNRITNLTAITELSGMITRHLLDSLSIQPWVKGRTIIDVGSGAGLPGIPLALFNPGKDFILLDSNGKKTRFMTQAVIDLGLDNVTVEHSRVQEFSGSFDHVVSRAFTNLSDMVTASSHLLAEEGTFLAMKGPDIDTESSRIDRGRWLVHQHRLRVPGLEDERYLAEIGRFA